METIGSQQIWSFVGPRQKSVPTSCREVRISGGHRVGSFMDLAKKVAELQFMNRESVLLFRGQPRDYLNKRSATSLRPALFRASEATKTPSDSQLGKRFSVLLKAEKILVSGYGKKFPGFTRLNRQQVLRWAIIQHYEICDTPLLDVTHSLRVAASFASIRAEGKAFVFVLGVPQLSGAVTASAEASLQILRLSSVCPPSAVRPHIQEGYLLGEYPEVRNANHRGAYKSYELDFGRRLVGKFWFDPTEFWRASGPFKRIGPRALYPNGDDPIFDLARSIKAKLKEDK